MSASEGLLALLLSGAGPFGEVVESVGAREADPEPSHLDSTSAPKNTSINGKINKLTFLIPLIFPYCSKNCAIPRVGRRAGEPGRKAGVYCGDDGRGP